MIVYDAINVLLDISVNRGNKKDKLLSVVSKFSENDWNTFLNISKIHQIQAMVYWELQNINDIKIPCKIEEVFKKSIEITALQYYSVFSFTTFVSRIFDSEDISYYVLKGITLNSLYYKEEIRMVTDADIYIPDEKDFDRACILLEKLNFKIVNVLVDHNVEYSYDINGRNYILELHKKPAATLKNKKADNEVLNIYGNLAYMPEYYYPLDTKVPALSTEEYGLQIILHMMQHFIGTGFGLKMLCDWMVFLNKKNILMNSDKFLGYLKRTGLDKFTWAVTKLCEKYLGLTTDKIEWFNSLSYNDKDFFIEKLYFDIISGGVFGKEVNTRMLILTGNKKIFEYAKIIHWHTCIRFPKLKRIPVLLPFLWLISIVLFLYNNRYLRKVKTVDILKNADSRSVLFREFGLYRKD